LTSTISLLLDDQQH